MLRRQFETERYNVRKKEERHNKEVIRTLQKKSIMIFKQRSVKPQATFAYNSHIYSSSEASMLMPLVVTGDS
jgi:hypothetical protein